MPNLAQQAAINVGSLPSDIEALNQVTKYHDDTVARQRELTQLSRGQIDLARASDDLHSGRLEAQRRIDEEEAWKNEEMATLELIQNLDHESDDFPEQLAIATSNISPLGLADRSTQFMIQGKMERHSKHNELQAEGRELNRQRMTERDFTYHEKSYILEANTAEEQSARADSVEVERAVNTLPDFKDLGIMSDEQAKFFGDIVNIQPAGAPLTNAGEIDPRSYRLAVQLNDMYKNVIKEQEKIQASAASAAQKERQTRISGAKGVAGILATLASNQQQLVLKASEAFSKKWLNKGSKGIPKEGDPLHEEYKEDKEGLEAMETDYTEIQQKVVASTNQVATLSGNPTIDGDDPTNKSEAQQSESKSAWMSRGK